MQDFSLIEKLKILMNIIISSPLFLSCLIVGIILLLVLIVCIVFNKKINKWIFIIIWGLLILILILGYRQVTLNLIDSLVENVFMALYFPNLTVYLITLFISNIFFIYSVIDKRIQKSHKILNIANCLIIDIFLFFIMDVVNKNSINVYDEITVFTNSDLLVLLELNSAIFTSWLLINLLISAYNKFKKYDKKKYPTMPEIIFDDEYNSI